MAISNLHQNIKTTHRYKKKLITALSLSMGIATSLIGIGVLSSKPASASCYGTGYSRYCDGVGGYGATYSKRGDFGSTTYSNGRRQTYSTYYY